MSRSQSLLVAAAVAAAVVVPFASPTTASAASSSCATPLGCLAPGDASGFVKIWQEDLNFYMTIGTGQCRPTLATDGIYGSLTTNATRCFQKLQGDGVDGIAGMQTQISMCKILQSLVPTSALFYQSCTSGAPGTILV